MKNIEEYGLLKDDEQERIAWLTKPRPPFQIWIKPEDISPFFIVQHYPYALLLLLKISDGFMADTFYKAGFEGSSKDWEALITGLIKEYEENNSGINLFHFDSDKDIFCVFPQYIDSLMMLAKITRTTCNDKILLYNYLSSVKNRQI